MLRPLRPICVVVVIASMCIADPAACQWLENGSPVLAETGPQYDAAILTDGAGGAFIAGTDRRNPSNKVYVQRIDGYGRPLWTENGVLTSTRTGYFYDPQMVADGEGGCFVAMSNADIIVQRLDADGHLLWGGPGVAACAATSNQQYPILMEDGAGGMVVVWQDYRAGNYDLYAQRLDADGNLLWDTDGNPVCTLSSTQNFPGAAPDGQGGVYVTWYDNRTGTFAVYVQHLDASGAAVWAADGIAVNLQPTNQTYPSIFPDGSGGAIVAFSEGSRLWLQRLDADGSLLWGETGVRPSTSLSQQYYTRLIPDEGSGYYLAWEEYVSGGYDIIAQRIDAAGNSLWNAGGVPIGSAPGNQQSVELAANVAGGFYATWCDRQSGYGDIRIQRVDPDGSIAMGAEGLGLCLATGDQLDPVLTTDGEGGAIVAWNDVRESSSIYDQSAVYAQRVERNGYWGFPAPAIATARDVPGDQGGLVYLGWDASRLDPWPEFSIEEYSVWRALNSSKHLPAAGSSGGGDIRVEQTLGRTFYWQKIATVPAAYLSGYAETVATLFDSTSVASEYHYFQVVAHTADPTVFWPSAPDSARSVDNLAPLAPARLAAQARPDPVGLVIDWAPNAEADIDHYVVHRGSGPDFVPDAGNLVAATADTTVVDGFWQWGDSDYYKVAAVDVHGNVGAFSALSPAAVTGVDARIPTATFSCDQNSPNPFNPMTRISFTLPGKRTVDLRIYDVAGRLVDAPLENESMNAGRHEISWSGQDRSGRALSAGVYFYRLDAGEFSATKRMTLVK